MKRLGNTYKIFPFITVFNTDIGLAILAEYLEWEMLEIRLDLCIIELSSDETFYIKYTEDYLLRKESEDMQKEAG